MKEWMKKCSMGSLIGIMFALVWVVSMPMVSRAATNKVSGDWQYSIHKNKTVTIQYRPSEDSKKNKIKIPSKIEGKSVTSIGVCAFADCHNLRNIIIPDSVTSIGGYAFFRCANLSDIIIPKNVTSIGAYAFSDCASLTSIIIPKSVTSIEEAAFNDCASLISIIIPKSVTSIGEDAFYGCSKDLVLIVEKNSYAEQYAKDNKLAYTNLMVTKVSSLKLKNTKSKKLTVTFKKISGAKYEVQYSTNKNFEKNTKKKTVSTNKATLSKLKKGKKYYVRVRAYKVSNGKKVYGKWSAVKKVTIKK